MASEPATPTLLLSPTPEVAVAPKELASPFSGSTFTSSEPAVMLSVVPSSVRLPLLSVRVPV